MFFNRLPHCMIIDLRHTTRLSYWTIFSLVTAGLEFWLFHIRFYDLWSKNGYKNNIIRLLNVQCQIYGIGYFNESDRQCLLVSWIASPLPRIRDFRDSNAVIRDAGFRRRPRKHEQIRFRLVLDVGSYCIHVWTGRRRSQNPWNKSKSYREYGTRLGFSSESDLKTVDFCASEKSMRAR